MRLTIASRKSDLARIQAFEVAQALRQQFPEIEIQHQFRASLGDQNLQDPLWQMPEKGVFTEDFVEDLIRGRCDLVVHSWKDLPLESRDQTEVVATLPRADMRDILLVRRDRWPKVAAQRRLRVLTSSPRRDYNLRSFLRDALPVRLAEIEFVPVRGNIPTRMRKLFEGDADALVLAKAALDRLLTAQQLEFQPLIQELRALVGRCHWMVLPLKENPTAAAQGALAIEIKKDRDDLKALLQKINCQRTLQNALAERELLKAYGGGCHQKIGMSQLTRDYGTVTFVRGTQERGEAFHYSKLERSVESPTGSVIGFWPLQVGTSSLYKRESVNDLQIPGDRCLWIARADALPDSFTAELSQVVWAAGIQTWKKLAARGVWVHGSSEGLGESEAPMIESLLAEPPKWLKLSHVGSPQGTMAMLATYRLMPTEARPDFSHVSHFFWTSGSQFDRAVELDPQIIHGFHACGPGSTYRHLKNRLGKGANRLQIYLSFEDWRKQMMSHS